MMTKYANSLKIMAAATAICCLVPLCHGAPTSFDIANGVLRGARGDAEEIVVPGGVKTVCIDGMVHGRMKILTIPEGVETISRRSGGYYPGARIETVRLPASVRTIRNTAFDGHWRRLRTIEIAAGSPYEMKNGCLIDTRSLSLVFALPGQGRIAVPESVKEIGPWAFNANDATEIAIPEGVAKICRGAFDDCRSLTKISLPASVDIIEPKAFAKCGKLTEIIIAPGNPRHVIRDGLLISLEEGKLIRAFGPLTRVVIPAEVKTIGEDAFSFMDSLVSVTVPDSVTRIEDSAFSYCKNLEELRLPKRLDFCGEHFIMGCAALKEIRLPVGLENLSGMFSFGGCSGLREIAFPEGLRSIGSSGLGAVSRCDALERIWIPASVTKIGGNGPFRENPRLATIDVHPDNPSFRSEGGVLFSKDMTRLVRCPERKKGVYEIPQTVKRIDGYAFANCHSLIEIRIPAGATDIGYGAFEDCMAKTKRVNSATAAKVEKPVFEIRDGAIRRMSLTEAEEIEVPQGVRTVGTRSIQRKAWYMRVLVLPEGVESLERGDDWRYNPGDPLEKVVIPASVRSIAPGAFFGFKNLATLDIAPGSPFLLAGGNLVDKRDGTLLYVLPANRTVVVQNGVKRICDHAFAGNDAVREVVLPEGVVAIGKNAFSACSSLETIRIPASISEIGDGAFSKCGKISLIEVSPDNPRYCVRDGMLMDKKTSTVVRAFGQPIRVEIPADVENIGEGAFSSMKSITFAVVPDSVKRIEKGAFSYCVQLEELLLPKRVEFCDGGIVQGCASLRAIEFPVGTARFSGQDLSHCDSLAELAPPEGVTALRGWKTIDCGNLARLVLPASLKDTDGAAYGSIPKLGAIEVNSGNQSFRSEEGVLFNKDMTRLIRCPETKKGVYIVPETVKRIDGHAFANCSSLTDVRIPAGATNIGFGAFSDGPAKTNGVALAEAGPSPGSESKAGNNPLDKLPKAGRIAWFDFSKGNEDMARPNRSFVCRNVTFEDGAMHFNGIYVHSGGTNGCNAELRVPELDRAGFTVGLWFRPDFNKGNSLPLLNFGHAYRWFYAHVGTGGRLFFGLNCHDIKLETKGVVDDQDWNWFVCSLDTAGKVLRCVLNGVRLEDVPIPENFAYKNMPERDKDLVDTTYWNGGRAFKGAIRGFALFGRPLSEGELMLFSNAAMTKPATARPASPAAKTANMVRIDGAEPGEWTHDWDAATAAAKERGMPVFVNFTGSDWCGWCMLLKRQVFSQPEWGGWASNNVYLVHIDFPKDKELVPEKYRDRNRELARKYKVGGYPTCYLLDPATLEPLGRFGAARDANAADFVAKVAAAMQGAGKKAETTKIIGRGAFEGGLVKTNRIGKVKSAAKTGDVSDSEDVSGFEIKDGVLLGLKRRDAEEIDVPSSVKKLRYGSFFGATRLRVVRLPEGLETIGERSFEQLRQLETVVIPASVTKIGFGAFLGCKRLTKLDIAPGSKFEVIDGLLLDKSAKTVLFAFPENRAVIPEFITVIGRMAFFGCEELKEVVLPEGLLKIEQSAFHGCRNLEALHLPASLETIENGAFAQCSALGRIDVAHGGRYAVFANCLIGDGGKTLIRGFGDMEELRIPDGVERVAPEAFSGSRALRRAYVPDSCTNIGYRAFGNCLKLEELRLPAKVEQCGSDVAGVCPNLRELAMPEGVMSISFTYQGCRSLKELKIPNSVKTIGQQAIEGCDGLTEIVFPEGVKAFSGNWIVTRCSNLLRIELPSTVERIQGTAVFGANPKLEAIDVSPSNQFFSSVDGVLFSKDMTRLVRCPETKKGIYEIPNSVKRIDEYAFANCRALTEIRIPEGATDIGRNAFENCPAKTKK